MTLVRSVHLNGSVVEYALKRSRGAKRTRVRVGPQGVQVILPASLAEARAEEVLKRNSGWVMEQLAFVKRSGSLRRSESDSNGFLLRGKQVRVKLINSPHAHRSSSVEYDSGVVYVKSPTGSPQTALKALELWLRREARSDIASTLSKRAVEIGRRPNRVYIMGQRTKWGNCSRKRNLSFNWRLVMAPPEVLDYIVVHELAHLIEPYHSNKFWLIVRSHCPLYPRYREWLRHHLSSLTSPMPVSLLENHFGEVRLTSAKPSPAA